MAARKIRFGFIGAGWWATANHMPILAKRDDVELTAVCRLGKSELQQVKEQFGFPFATESAEELVNVPGLDAVVVSSPHTLHYEHARLALQRGLQVMGETCPPYLFFTLDHLRRPDGAKWVCSPPMRSVEDNLALWRALADGTIQTVGGTTATIAEKNAIIEKRGSSRKPTRSGKGPA